MQKGHGGPTRPSPGLPTGVTHNTHSVTARTWTAARSGTVLRVATSAWTRVCEHVCACVCTRVCTCAIAFACTRVRTCIITRPPASHHPGPCDHDLFPASVSLSFRGCRTRGSLRDVPRGLGFLHAAGRPGDCRSPCVTGSSPMPLPRPPPPARVTLDRSPVQERWDVFSLGLLRIKLL